MKPLSYRNRLRLKRIGVGLLLALLVAALLAIGVTVYLGRYLVFTDEGAYLSFLQKPDADAPAADEPAGPFAPVDIGPAGIAVRPQTAPPSTPTDDEPEPEAAIRGIYLSYRDLQDTKACLDAVHAMDDCNTVLLPLKSSAGYYYYASAMPDATAADIDTEAVNAMIAALRQEGYRLIARIPAFTDTAFALAHISSSLQIQNGALWMDADGYYWLNAADADTQQLLNNIALELAGLGIDEIAFTGFVYPQSENIVYGDLDEIVRAQALSAAAGQLIDLGASEGFAVSFCDPEDGCPSPSADGHVFLSGIDGAGAAGAEETYRAWIHDASSLVFLTDSRDTRFQPYGILRSSQG